MSEPYGHAQFCDDIREEVGGKFTLVGLYNHSLIIPAEPPNTLPKLCINVMFRWPADLEWQDLIIKMFVEKGEQKSEMGEMKFSRNEKEQTADAVDSPNGPDNENKVVEVGARAIFQNLLIDDECNIRVRGYLVQGEQKQELRAGTLKILFRPPQVDGTSLKATQADNRE